jgi:iron uptake system EfeUOB component EfeO/EfeM
MARSAGWERSEVFTSGFVPELDSEIDAWPDATTGFHAIEAKLFGAGTTDVAGDADALVMHLDDLHDRLRSFPLTSQGLMDGIVRLATRSAKANPTAANPASAAPPWKTCATTSPVSSSRIGRFSSTA